MSDLSTVVRFVYQSKHMLDLCQRIQTVQQYQMSGVLSLGLFCSKHFKLTFRQRNSKCFISLYGVFEWRSMHKMWESVLMFDLFKWVLLYEWNLLEHLPHFDFCWSKFMQKLSIILSVLSFWNHLPSLLFNVIAILWKMYHFMS